jgi:hypothetical protein
VFRVARYFSAQTYQNGEKYNKGPNICQMAIKYNKWHKLPIPNGLIPLSSIAKPSKIYPNLDFRFKNT